MEGASEGNLAEIYSSFYYIPTRVSLDVAGVGDVFSY
jgi:hypothetical protein